MSEMDVIRQIAQQALTVPTLAGVRDNWLWDRTLRILRNVEHICRMPELTDKNTAVDRFCLIAATYFADAGFAHYADAEDMSARLVLADISQTDLRDFSTQVVNDKLSGALAGPRIDKINKIIVESSNRFTDMTEAMILSDAQIWTIWGPSGCTMSSAATSSTARASRMCWKAGNERLIIGTGRPGSRKATDLTRCGRWPSGDSGRPNTL